MRCDTKVSSVYLYEADESWDKQYASVKNKSRVN